MIGRSSSVCGTDGCRSSGHPSHLRMRQPRQRGQAQTRESVSARMNDWHARCAITRLGSSIFVLRPPATLMRSSGIKRRKSYVESKDVQVQASTQQTTRPISTSLIELSQSDQNTHIRKMRWHMWGFPDCAPLEFALGACPTPNCAPWTVAWYAFP